MNGVLPEPPVPRAPAWGQISPRLEMLHRAMAALRFVPRLQRSVSGKALLLLLLTSPKGRRCAGRSQGKQQPPGSVVGSAAGKAGGTPALLPWDAHPHKPGGQLDTGQLPRPKSAEIKLTLPSSGAKVGAKESQGRGREAARTRKAAASVVNISHFNCLNDTLRDRCATQRVP